MKLLVCTQAVDQDDPALGFFHEWIRALADRFESVEVICLQEGRHALSDNVRVHSLGKESGRKSRGRYAARFLQLAWSLRNSYDAVFVHQNQEYVLLAGWLWKFLGKRIFMWRNHYAGSSLTGLAAAFCDKIFCTSAHSYTARYANTVLMPVGVDTDLFKFSESRTPHSILFLGRITPSKRPDLLVESLGLLVERGVRFTATLCGPVLSKDEGYFAALKRRAEELGLTERVTFRDGVSHDAAATLYASHEIFVNLSGSGMYDKTMFEAAASGCIVIALSKDFTQHIDAQFVPQGGNAEAIARALEHALSAPADENIKAAGSFRSLAETNSLKALEARLAREMKL
ncbi:glycosyltransferase family 4 protein [Candidatus Kaiserbacteria bacterium]|nr:glycosyltransferase family 4 protein [Candidatus Kaiserbacteria bacterium]